MFLARYINYFNGEPIYISELKNNKMNWIKQIQKGWFQPFPYGLSRIRKIRWESRNLMTREYLSFKGNFDHITIYKDQDGSIFHEFI